MQGILAQVKTQTASQIKREMTKLKRLEQKAEKNGILEWIQEHAVWVGVTFALILIAVGIFYWIRRRRAKAASGDAGVAKPPKLNLIGTWRKFRRGLPRRYRSSIKLFRPFFVFGASGSGKTTLIEQYIDWRGQDRLYRHSETSNSNVQVYHGPAQFVFEFSGNVLEDTTERTRRELKKLWRSQKDAADPVFYFVISADSLVGDPVERIVRDVQLARGKVNVLSTLLGRPVRFGIVLTHMDNCTGYREFQAGLFENNVRLRLDLTGETTDGDLQQQMKKFEVYLPYLMKMMSPDDYLRAASFIEESDTLLGRIQIILDELRIQDPTSFDPQLDALYMTSRDDVDSDAANPFEVILRHEEVVEKHPYRFHRRAAALLGALGIAYVFSGYMYERATIKQAELILSEAMNGSAEEFSDRVQNDFYDYISDRRNSIWSRILLDFSPEHDVFLHQQIKDDYIRSVETKLLLPEIERLRKSTSGADMEKYLYLSGLAAATEKNEIGTFIDDHSGVWARVTGLSEMLIKDYVTHQSNTRYISPDVSHLISSEAVNRILEIDRVEDWASFFDFVTTATANNRISDNDLKRLGTTAAAMRREVRMLAAHSVTLELLELFSHHDEINIGPHWRLEISHRATADEYPVLRIADLVDSSNLVRPVDGRMTLKELLAFTKGLDGQGRQDSSLHVMIDNRAFNLDGVKWKELIRRSSVMDVFASYRTQSWEGKPWQGVLFGDTRRYPDIHLNAVPGDNQLYAGQATIDGLLTMEAFTAEVQPLLNTLKTDLEELNLPVSEANHFSEFVDEILSSYADEYEHAYTEFFQAHVLREFTPQLMPFVARQMASSSSPLLGLVKCIRDNTSFELDKENQYAGPFESVRDRFQGVSSLIGKNPAKSPLWLAYQKLAYQLGEQLGSDIPAKAPKKGAGNTQLLGTLSPYGRMAFEAAFNVPGSLHTELYGWLNSANLSREWRGPLVDVFEQSRRLGNAEIEAFVSKKWTQLYNTYYRPMSVLFPFDRSAQKVAQLDVLRAALHPKGDFWKDFNAFLAPFCEQTPSGWVQRGVGVNGVEVPVEMLAIVNRMQAVRELLWDEKGKEQPIEIQLRALPFPHTKTEHQPVIGTLQVGASSVFLFNQRAQWQSLSMEWWKPVPARLSVGFAEYDSQGRHYAGVAANSEEWSFLRLMRKARRQTRSKFVWFWNVTSDLDDVPPTSVRFQFREDPWTLLDIRADDGAF